MYRRCQKPSQIKPLENNLLRINPQYFPLGLSPTRYKIRSEIKVNEPASPFNKREPFTPSKLKLKYTKPKLFSKARNIPTETSQISNILTNQKTSSLSKKISFKENVITTFSSIKTESSKSPRNQKNKIEAVFEVKIGGQKKKDRLHSNNSKQEEMSSLSRIILEEENNEKKQKLDLSELSSIKENQEDVLELDSNLKQRETEFLRLIDSSY